MLFFRLVPMVILVVSLIVPSLALGEITSIDSFEDAKNIIINLRSQGVDPEDIAVLLDFHGVLCHEGEHSPPLTPKKGAHNFLSFLKKEVGIPFVCATAWNDLNQVIKEGIVHLGLSKYFEVDPEYEALLDTVYLGKRRTVTLESYQNGRVAALKEVRDEFFEGRDPWFRQKIFALEKIYPNRRFKYIIAIDDGKGNLEIMEKDFPKTTHGNDRSFKELILLHLRPSNTH
jgi:hypothetical protein